MNIFCDCEFCGEISKAGRDNMVIRQEHTDTGGRIISTIEFVCPKCGKKNLHTQAVRIPINRYRKLGESRF